MGSRTSHSNRYAGGRSSNWSPDWAERVEPVRAPLGRVEQRDLANVTRANSLPGAPDGEYEVLQFKTQFAGKDGPRSRPS
ncbi:DUF4019 domain-containing protein [Erythrobacter sp.]|uniref:DUF4019 domain-containing protein n=1 Tax=Erythrobacter sp. TaxID=1042 RepID=UPI003C78CD5C